MSKKIQLSIPTPCHEDWNEMTAVEKGKFCGSCQKQVVDFSKMGDREIAQFFKKPTTGSVCGRFMSDQLERDIEIPRKRIPWMKYFFQIALPAFFFSKASGQKSMGQQSRPASKDTIRVPLNNEFRTLGMVMPTHIVPVKDTSSINMIVDAIEVRGERGKVVDAQTGLALIGAEITMISTIGTEKYQSDKDGQFVLNTIRKITIQKIEISYPGYDTQELSFAAFMNLGGKHIVKLEKTTLIVGDTIIREQDCTPVTMGRVAMPYKPVKTGPAIKGYITNVKGEAIPFATIVIKDTRTAVASDANGEFIISPPANLEKIVLVGSSVGYEMTEIQIDRNIKSPVSIQLANLSTNFIGGEITVCRVSKPKKEIKEVPLMLSAITDANAGSFKVYPNPVAPGASFSIEWKQSEEGYFSLQVLNQGGQSVQQQEIWIDAEARVLNIEAPRVAAGSYFLVLTNKKSGKKFTEKIVVQ